MSNENGQSEREKERREDRAKNLKFRIMRIYRRFKAGWFRLTRWLKKGWFRSIRWLRAKWLWSITIVFLVFAVFTIVFSDGIQNAALIGDYLAGFAGALAFLWLVASFRLQSKELSLQRKELELQRIALEQQAKELRNSAKFSALTQINQIINGAEESLQNSESEIKKPSDIIIGFANGMALWKDINESTNASKVLENFQAWLKIEGTCRNFLSSLVTASKIYLQNYMSIEFDDSKSNEEFFLTYHPLFAKAPYISRYSGIGYMIANFLFMSEPGLKAIQLAGFTAQKQVLGKDLLKEGVCDGLAEYLTSRDIDLPAIVRAQ